MARRSSPWLFKAAVLGCCLVAALLWLTATTTASRVTGTAASGDRPADAGADTGPDVLVLQVNLCNSGLATCYTGRSVPAAADLIRSRRPDIVTVDEICRPDLVELRQAMSAAHHTGLIASAFRAAGDRDTGNSYTCRNGAQYGIGVVARVGSPAYHSYSGRYPSQDLSDPEERVWVCLHAPGQFYACSTHAASTSAAIAVSQCRHLVSSALPAIRRTGDPVVIGADLNIASGRSPGPQSCAPRGYQRADDGALQDVVAGPGLAVRSRTIVDMHGTTDHPGLLVELTRSR